MSEPLPSNIAIFHHFLKDTRTLVRQFMVLQFLHNMPHKKRKSKQSGVDQVETSASAATASSSTAPQSTMSTKHGFSDDADKASASDRSKKRRKPNTNTGLHHHDSPLFDVPVNTTAQNIQHPEDTSTQTLPREIRHLSTKYNFTTMSILSSAKISDKVEKLLLRVENFSFADPKSKPGVVVLRAKSDVASKMVSIVEIARHEIERGKGKWWQYSKVNAEIAQLMAKPVKVRDAGRTLSEWQKEQTSGESQGTTTVGGKTGPASEVIEHDHQIVDRDEEMEDAFESMVVPKVDRGAKQSETGDTKKIRATPVMTIYFARVPVPGLKELYGYVLIYFVEGIH